MRLIETLKRHLLGKAVGNDLWLSLAGVSYQITEVIPGGIRYRHLGSSSTGVLDEGTYKNLHIQTVKIENSNKVLERGRIHLYCRYK